MILPFLRRYYTYLQRFLARNRIVSGLTTGLLITEAREKSGTLHAARFVL